MDPAAPVQGAWQAAVPIPATWRAARPSRAALLPGAVAAFAGGMPLPDAVPAPGEARTGATAAAAADADAGIDGTGTDKAEREKLIENSGRPAESSAKRPADIDDPVSLDELATKVYPRLRQLLRGELLVDRERAGLLGELG